MSEAVTIEERVAALEAQVEFLSKDRPGRKMKPNLTSREGICGIDPECDSATCTDASIYRFQQGCRGTRCEDINREYYVNYRAERRAKTRTNEEVVVDPPPPLVLGNGEHSTSWTGDDSDSQAVAS